MKVLVVEDDYLQVDWLQRRLQSGIPTATVESIATESEFRKKFEEIAEDRPGCIIIDVMLPWAVPGSDPEAPPEVKEGGFFRAGLRCQEWLAKNDRTKDIPVIFYTVLEEGDLKAVCAQFPANVRYLRKDADDQELIALIRQLTDLR